MRKCFVFLLIIGIGISGLFMAAQDEEIQNKYYIRATIYPTFSLSRYDYNNDLDHVEIRCYIELRKDSLCGSIIDNATVKVNHEILEFKDKTYRKRIDVSKEKLSEEIALHIAIPDGIELEQTYPVPDWLVIKTPRPSLIEPTQPLTISWNFRSCPGPVEVDAYNFKTGNSILQKNNYKDQKIEISEEKLPKESLIRILVMHTWLYKQYIRGPQIARRSEINIMPWSQVFIRTK
ncbi:MAG: hypothetical protein GF421_03660 [Candidatus Aminicenantes bacterium]|nr:hypothetical protein [Candidatus Aminicenantes bacterium]